MTDKVDQAIATADSIEMLQIPVTVNATGRPFVVSVPSDMTELEVISMVGWITTQLVNQLAANRAAKSRIVVVRGGLPQ